MFKVPKKTTIYKTETKHTKYALGFGPELIQFILSGKKVKTYRFGLKYDFLQPGDVITVLDTVNMKPYGRAKVLSKKLVTFKELSLDNPGHEAYKNKEHQRQVFSGYYAFTGKPVEDNDPFLVFEFKLV